MINIVIVEDDPILAAIYEHKLKDVDCSIQTATDGQFGYELILKTKPDLVLLDLTLPRLSGADILERLRAQEEFKSLPVIVFSASTTSALAGAARRAHALYVLPKEHSTADKIVAIISRIFPGSMKRKFQTVDSARQAEQTVGVQVGQQQEKEAPPRGRGKVLVAEDDLVILSVITSVIEKEGYTVIAARDGREAYSVLRRDADIEAAIFDVQMPYIEGTDLLRYIRHDKLLKDIPILIITAQTSINIQTDVFASGVSQFAVKPFTRAELRRKFLGLMSSAKA